MGTIIDQETTGEPLLLTGTVDVTDMTFRQLRQLTQSPNRAGVQNGADYRVTDAGAGAVGVALGYAWVAGTTITGPEGQHLYGVPLPTARTLTGIPTPSSATRRDQIVVRVYDEGDAPGGGGLNEGRVQYIANAVESTTPEAVPANSMLLYHVDVTTGGAKTIIDRRVWASGDPLVSSLPANPVDGQVVLYQHATMVTQGVVWPLRYNALSASAFKWEGLSAPPLTTQSDTGRSRTNPAYGSLPTDPLGLTAPLAGDYLIGQSAAIAGDTPAADYYLGYEIGATPASDADALLVERVTSASGNNISSVSRSKRKDNIPAGTIITEKARGTSGTGTYLNRMLSLTPIRVG